MAETTVNTRCGGHGEGHFPQDPPQISRTGPKKFVKKLGGIGYDPYVAAEKAPHQAKEQAKGKVLEPGQPLEGVIVVRK
jgi:hypothetical protein